MKIGDFVVGDSFVNATLYRITSIDGDVVQLDIPKRDGSSEYGGQALLSSLSLPNSKQREEYKDILKG